MIEIEKFQDCNDINEATARERYWYELLNANMNTNCPEQTKDKLKEQQKEYYELNKDNKIAYQKDYYESNKIDISVKQRIYNKTHAEEITQRNKKKYESNKEAIHVKQKLYRDAHKEQINRKCICDICGREHLCRSKSEHIKSQFHLKALNNSNQ
jgi:hypothetical protein